MQCALILSIIYYYVTGFKMLIHKDWVVEGFVSVVLFSLLFVRQFNGIESMCICLWLVNNVCKYS